MIGFDVRYPYAGPSLQYEDDIWRHPFPLVVQKRTEHPLWGERDAIVRPSQPPQPHNIVMTGNYHARQVINRGRGVSIAWPHWFHESMTNLWRFQIVARQYTLLQSGTRIFPVSSTIPLSSMETKRERHRGRTKSYEWRPITLLPFCCGILSYAYPELSKHKCLARKDGIRSSSNVTDTIQWPSTTTNNDVRVWNGRNFSSTIKGPVVWHSRMELYTELVHNESLSFIQQHEQQRRRTNLRSECCSCPRL